MALTLQLNCQGSQGSHRKALAGSRMRSSDEALKRAGKGPSRECEDPMRNTRGFPFIENALSKYAMPLGGGGSAMNVLSWRRP